MTETFKYGRKTISVNAPDQSELLEISEPENTINKNQFIQDLISVLPDEKIKYRNTGIVISDKTRLCAYPLYLPCLIEALISKGADKGSITFYIAYGTHPAQTGEESLSSYGEVYNNYKFVHHNCNDIQSFIKLGVTKRGTPVTVRRDVLESSLLLTFGAISHHYFAGYGGGRKLLFPGLADRKSVYHNHALFLDKENGVLDEGCQPGNLEENPIAADLKEIDDLMPPKISIHGILNSRGEVCKLLIGKDYRNFLEACREHDMYFKSGITKQYDMVVASSGGYPKDINFIQAHKSLHYAAAFVKNGGKLILLTECIDGIGSDFFLKYMEAGSFEKAFKMLKDNYEGNGGTALSLMTKTKRIMVFLCTSLDEQICNILNVKKISEDDINMLVKSHSGTFAYIKNASLLFK